MACNYSYSDPDGDAEGASTIEWTVIPRSGSAMNYTRKPLSGVFAKGDTVKCTVKPYDGTNYGSEQSSTSLVISNTAPTASAVNITPSPAQTTDRLTCNYSYADADGDTEGGTAIQWTVLSSSGSSSTYTGATLRRLSLGDTITCKVSPKDGTDLGVAVTSPPTSVSNSVPKATGVSVRPNPARAGNTLSCNYTYSDPDGDPESGM